MYKSDSRLESIFTDLGVEGTTHILALTSGDRFVHNPKRSATRLVPASSFKVPNTLIALQTGAIASVDEVIQWDGVRNERFPAWNTDQTLKSAFRYSCVWFYQELARRVGSDAYRKYVDLLNFGKLASQFAVTTFWLDGSLAVSAEEQVNFLKSVRHRELPFSEKAYDILADLMLEPDTSLYKLRGKTGWGMRADPQVGWYVGYVETPQDQWVFATNIEIQDESQLPLRQIITLKALHAVGAIPEISDAHLQLRLTVPKEAR
jgi:beta-lactamase class D